MEHAERLVELGRYVRERRRVLGLTQAELGARLGWAQERVSVLETGKYGLPSLPQLCRLADGLGVAVDDLLRPLGVEVVREPRGAGVTPQSHAGSRLSLRLVDLIEQVRTVDERLHDAEHQMVRVELLRNSLREQRELMRTLLDASRR